MVFPIVMYRCESWTKKKKSWAPKNWCLQSVVLGKILESPLDSKENKPVNPEGNQPCNIYWKDWCWSWSFSIPAIWCRELTHWKRPQCWERLGARRRRGWQDQMAGWHHWLDGHEFERTLGNSEGQGCLACYRPWGCKESDRTEQNWATTTGKLEMFAESLRSVTSKNWG